ncbi:unnamed protein product [Ilex paraguariensis]|uniref:RING-CH-type domain-containing protein n=1 Tax=Ilex paraguariensis TaxID=185542 RepID=A0ABC8QZJ8_9AQUA
MEPEIHDGRVGDTKSTNPFGGFQPEAASGIRSEDPGILCGEDCKSGLKSELTEMPEVSREEQKAKEPEPAENEGVIDIKYSGENLRAEKVCRICHLSAEQPLENGELMQLGCGCKGELGISHRSCAEAWFEQKGNRLCEICGKPVTNISVREDSRIFMVEWNERTLVAAAPYSSLPEGSRRCKHSFCNFLLACLVLAFILPWFLRVDIL